MSTVESAQTEIFKVSHVAMLSAHTDKVTSLVTHVSQMILMSSCKDGSMIIWQPKQAMGSEPDYSQWLICNHWNSFSDALPEGHSDAVTDLCIGRKGTTGARAVSASMDKSVSVWDLNTGQLVRKMRDIHDMGILSATLSRDGNKVITGSMDSSMKVLDLRLGMCAVEYSDAIEGAYPGPVTRVRMNPEHKTNYFFSCGTRNLKKWDLRMVAPGKVVEDLNWMFESWCSFTPRIDLHLLEYAPVGNRLVCGGKSPTVNIWDLSEAGDCTQNVWNLVEAVECTQNRENLSEVMGPVLKVSKCAMSFGTGTSVSSVKFSPDMCYLAVATGSKVYIWHLKLEQNIGEIERETSQNLGEVPFPTSVAWSFDGRYIFVGFSDGIIGVFNFQTS